ncbi:MAG: GntR family transcriptional regulator [Fusobacteriaceae bacterium]|jgi:DNA-binding GntR family transcriptional regulator|nr:GntR family transcriptional regulator [Fusobacteriaceae bacterium]
MNLVKKTLNEQIYEILKEDILNGKIAFGEKLVNRELQDKFSVSSTPVRDAINKLHMDGLIQEVSKTGAKVINFDLNFAEEVNEFICVICSSAVKISAQKGEADNVIDALEKIINMQENARNDDEYCYYDFKFHKTFLDFSKNIFLIGTFKRYNVLRRVLTRIVCEDPENKQEALQHHRSILEKYKAKDYDGAMEVMLGHYKYGIEKLKEKFSE